MTLQLLNFSLCELGMYTNSARKIGSEPGPSSLGQYELLFTEEIGL
jgi:hypothetical protein